MSWFTVRGAGYNLAPIFTGQSRGYIVRRSRPPTPPPGDPFRPFCSTVFDLSRSAFRLGLPRPSDVSRTEFRFMDFEFAGNRRYTEHGFVDRGRGRVAPGGGCCDSLVRKAPLSGNNRSVANSDWKCCTPLEVCDSGFV